MKVKGEKWWIYRIREHQEKRFDRTGRKMPWRDFIATMLYM